MHPALKPDVCIGNTGFLIRVKLREAMEKARERTGKRHTYASIARACGVSSQTIQSLASREDYNPSLRMIDQVCSELGCGLSELLEYQPDGDPQQSQGSTPR